MSEILNGDSSHITTPLVRTVTALSSGGGGAVRVTTSAPHLFGPNDNVAIATAVISGTFRIAIIDPTHVDLVGTVYTSTSTGTASDLSLTPQVQVPTDGDTFSAQLSGLLSAQQALLDRDQFLQDSIVNAVAKAPSGVAVTFTVGLGTSTVLAVTSNGPPCELQTVAAHHLHNGMWVTITGATGDTAINGTWPVTTVDNTRFTIPVQGSGSYGASSATVTPVVPPGVTWMLVDGWGGGGGGEGGGGVGTTPIGSAFLSGLWGGGGSGAPLTVQVMQVTPLDPLTVTLGAGGSGGSGGVSPATSATPGTNGGDSVVTAGANSVTCVAGIGAGVGENSAVFVETFTDSDAAVAPGGHREDIYADWTFITWYPFHFTADHTNISNFLKMGPADGGAAVLPGPGGTMPNPSTNGLGNSGFAGGPAGAKGANDGGYRGGAGGGGGGAGPGGVGGTGGFGTDAKHAGNSANGQTAPSLGGPSNTGAGGGGGGSAGAASGTTGNGGNGADGDNGSISLYWVGVPQ